jgi:plastocyanin
VRRGSWPAVAALAVVIWGVALAPTALPAATGPSVQMVDNEPDLTNWHFDPADLTVPAGSTVVWHNRGKEEHSVTADDKSFDSGLKPSGTDFQHAFPKAGVYAYHCAPHPWMTGRIHVTAAATTTVAPTTVTTAPVAPPPTAAAGGPAPAPAGSAPSGSAPAGSAGGGGQPGAASTSSTAKQSAGASQAAPASSHHRSGGHLAGTIVLVLGPTLVGLALGARLRQSRS